MRSALFLQIRQRLSRLFNHRLQLNDVLGCRLSRCFQFRLITQRRKFISQPRCIARCTVRPPLRIDHGRIGYPQFRVCPRLFGRCFSEGHLALARLSFGGIACTGEGRAFVLNRFNLDRERSALRLQPRQRISGIVSQLAFACTVVGHTRCLCRQVSLTLDNPVAFAGELHELVRQIARCVPRSHCDRPRFGQFTHRSLLPFGQVALGSRGLIDGSGRRLCFCARRIGRRLCLLPAHENQPRFGLQYLFGKLAVTFGLLCLPSQLPGTRIHIGKDRRQTCQIGFCRTQFLFGILASDMQTGNACCFLQHLSPLLRFGRYNCANPSLTDQRRRVRAGRRVGKNQRNILRPDIAAVGPVSRARTALDAAGDLNLVIVVIGNRADGNIIAIAFCRNRDLCKVARWA